MRRWIARLGGWYAAIILAALVLAMELGSFEMGGDTGGLLWVPAHFVVTPALSVLVLVATLLRVWLTEGWRTRCGVAASAVIPIVLAYLVIDVGAWLAVMHALIHPPSAQGWMVTSRTAAFVAAPAALAHDFLKPGHALGREV